MDEQKIDQLLYEIYSQDILPSKGLFEKTKYRIQNNNSEKYLLGLVVCVNLFVSGVFFYLMFFASISIIIKLFMYCSVSCLTNILIAGIYVKKEQVKFYFENMDKA